MATCKECLHLGVCQWAFVPTNAENCEDFKEREKGMETIRIKYLRDVEPIQEIEGGDWLDLRAAERKVLFAGDYVKIPLGVAMELPKGHEAWVVPRSSTFKKYGVMQVNSPAVIDGKYCGDNDEWNFLGYATKDAIIEKNERICQFRIVKNQPKLNWDVVEELGNPDRGGIGSTGRR